MEEIKLKLNGIDGWMIIHLAQTADLLLSINGEGRDDAYIGFVFLFGLFGTLHRIPFLNN